MLPVEQAEKIVKLADEPAKSLIFAGKSAVSLINGYLFENLLTLIAAFGKIRTPNQCNPIRIVGIRRG